MAKSFGQRVRVTGNSDGTDAHHAPLGATGQIQPGSRLINGQRFLLVTILDDLIPYLQLIREDWVEEIEEEE